MKRAPTAIIFAFGLLLSEAVLSDESVVVKPEGETRIVVSGKKGNVEVVLRTHKQDIGKPSDGKPTRIDSSCTYSKFPCSVIDGLEIRVDGRALHVPRSTFCDLADAKRAAIVRLDNSYVLTIYGGGASEGYVARVEFTGEQILRRALSSSILPKEPSQETMYYKRVIP